MNRHSNFTGIVRRRVCIRRPFLRAGKINFLCITGALLCCIAFGTGCAETGNQQQARIDFLVDSMVKVKVYNFETRLKTRNDSTIRSLARLRADSTIAVLKAR